MGEGDQPGRGGGATVTSPGSRFLSSSRSRRGREGRSECGGELLSPPRPGQRLEPPPPGRRGKARPGHRSRHRRRSRGRGGQSLRCRAGAGGAGLRPLLRPSIAGSGRPMPLASLG
jgi:hypothetical protein